MAIPATASIPLELRPQDTSLAVYSITEGPIPYGLHAGTPAVIIRLQGCPVGCPWCNQPHGIAEPTIAPVELQATEEQIESPGNTAGFRWLTGTRLLALIGSYQSRHVFITGGEPALYDLAWFTAQLIDQGYRVQVETSGTLPLSVDARAFVTLSPKFNQPGGYQVWDWIYQRADEVIQLITGVADMRWVDRALKAKRGITVFLMPLQGRPDLAAFCWHMARVHCLRICLYFGT